MKIKQMTAIRTGNVDERTTRGGGMGITFGVRAAMWMAMAAVVAVMLVLTVAAPAALAAGESATPSQQGTGSSDVGVTVTNNITDTENLLGDNLGKVSDALSATKKETGVTVRLLYLPKFSEGQDPDQWAAGLLKDSNPAPNTVMLAVASEDGNLVVVVSSNSDEWLKKQDTVDALSQAALNPLTKGDTPDWSGSAIALTDQIKTLHEASSTSKFSGVGIIVFIVALAILVVAAVVFVILHRRGKSHADRQLARRERRRSGRRPRAGDDDPDAAATTAAPAPASGGRHATPTVAASQTSSNDSADIQETSSAEGHA
ncbi:TPM domain-containing protein [Bifidobacterium sp. 82T24]|uniref:TPM domain-containing protein n=1 Tax=Bifidobacterium pluvialisilvae TaxID=2834436 RepID=UPI001C57F09E|nr:TPM domain-containing protein [Bifidobacterium pluvialisilvae]MBW3087159.1 TPM domain-containing protein [Bifidobacterium pluvialisilvae]